MQESLNVKVLNAVTFSCHRNLCFDDEALYEPHANITAELNGQIVSFSLPIRRDPQTHQLSAYTPQGGICAGADNNARLAAAGLPLTQYLAAFSELVRLTTEKLRFERTEDDQITEGLLSHRADILNMHELYASGVDYDGVDYDETDDFHKWLVENDFADVDTDDETGEKTLQLFGDWRDRLSDYFSDYFLSVRIANTPEGDAPCVEADICIGGPTCYLRQFFGRGYTLVYSWGALSDEYGFDSEVDAFLDDMFGIFC